VGQVVTREVVEVVEVVSPVGRTGTTPVTVAVSLVVTMRVESVATQEEDEAQA
jgi:hypothetical protein